MAPDEVRRIPITGRAIRGRTGKASPEGARDEG